MSASFRWVACTAVVPAPSSPWSASSRVGGAARRRPGRPRSRRAARTGARAAGGRRRPRGRRAAESARHRADRVHGGARPGPERRRGGAPSRSAQAVRVPVAEPALHPVQRQVAGGAQPAGEIAGVEQGEPDPGLRGGLDERVAHRVGVGVRAAARGVVQVVELPHAGVAGQRPSRRTPPGPGRSRSPGSSRAATAYICSRQVQNVPPPAWVRPRSARWNAWLWPLASPGSTRPGSTCVARARAGACRTR